VQVSLAIGKCSAPLLFEPNSKTLLKQQGLIYYNRVLRLIKILCGQLKPQILWTIRSLYA
jgi:hypothetical protein